MILKHREITSFRRFNKFVLKVKRYFPEKNIFSENCDNYELIDVEIRSIIKKKWEARCLERKLRTIPLNEEKQIIKKI